MSLLLVLLLWNRWRAWWGFYTKPWLESGWSSCVCGGEGKTGQLLWWRCWWSGSHLTWTCSSWEHKGVALLTITMLITFFSWKMLTTKLQTTKKCMDVISIDGMMTMIGCIEMWNKGIIQAFLLIVGLSCGFSSCCPPECNAELRQTVGFRLLNRTIATNKPI